jgi:signal peptidase II
MNDLNKIKQNYLFSNKNVIVCATITFFIFFLDRISKIKIIEHQIENNRLYVNEFINLELVWNTGIAFGFLSSNTSLIYNLTTALIGIVILFLVYLIFKSKFIDKFFFSMILGGALGNFYDRIAYFAVPDFIDLHYKNFHWFTFNIADIFISLGVIILIFNDLLTKNEKN